ncbi:tetratricopeptide repeat protein [Streptomyces sp. NPDC002599]|uniref:tetratricopeptide repeat protein n=1 Tax=Streptomyces sp. NPDC002599 TaxID=3154421 RepID=UPI00332D587E
MTPAMDFDTLRRAMADNYEQPEGPGRNARAEQLLVEAERLNIPLAVVEALVHQLKVYNYSSEKGKMFVPFSRLLRMWDEHPEDFDEFEIHSLHWVFKWVSAGMLDQPHVPLASIEKWLGEMERRYRLAGHSERAVRGAEFSVAAHLGDLERAERAYTAWLAADRDSMADCHACELHGQGWWRAVRGADEEALELWAPVLRGEYTCAHEPHTVLASSLLPLLRLGRTEEARSHHLRGFRLVRAMESLRGAYADHVEFCALTGNEARALELLAERPAYFTDSGDPRSRLDFMSVVALAMDRLTVLGLGGQSVPGPAGRGWTAAELAVHARGEALALAARFDERNGTSYVGERARARMDQPVLVGRLSLGVRSAAPARSGSRPPAPVPAPPEAGAGAAEPGLDALLAEARRLSALRDPDAVEAWAAVSRAAEGQELAVRDRAEIADHAAMGRGPQGAALFHRAAGLYAEAGDPGEALAARSRAAYVQALSGGSAQALEVVTELRAQALALFAEGGTGVSQTASVLVSRARTLMHRVDELETGAVNGQPLPDTGSGSGSEADVMVAADEAARELLALAEAHAGDDAGLASRAAEAYAMLGELAARADDAEAAAGLLRRAVDGFVAAGLPWFAVEYDSRLAGIATHLGDLEAAERATRDALDHGGSHLEPMGHAQLHLRLAETLAATGQLGPASEHALEAAHWADEAGGAATFGAWARHHLGGFLLRLGRWSEAAEILESALPDLTAEMHGEGAIVQTRWWLGDCLTELGEHRKAAEHWLRAADIARHWPEQRDHAMLANLAAEALTHAGMTARADQAYARACDLWRELGDVGGLVRTLRARAWAAAWRDGVLGEARKLMAEAIQECASAAKGRPAAPDSPGAGQPDGADGPSEAGAARTDRGADAGVGVGVGVGVESEDAEAGLRLVAELGHTHRQFGDLVARSVPDDAEEAVVREVFEEALGHMARAITVFASLGDPLLGARTATELAAGWLEADLGRHEAASARARTVLAVCDRLDAETAGARRAEAEKMRELTRKAG